MQFIKRYSWGFGLVLLNIILKSWYLTSESISHDEPFSIYHAQFDLPALINWLKHYNNPPLYEIILHFWIRLFGVSEIAVRILPMLFSSVSVFFVFKITFNLFDKRSALLAALLFSFSTMQIWYAHDCRVYSLFLLLTLISFDLFFKLLKNEKKQIVSWIGLLLVNALLMYAHYFGAFVLLVQCIITGLFFRSNKPVLKFFSATLVLLFLLYIPQLPVVYQRFFSSEANGTWLKVPNGIESIYNMFWSFSNVPVTTVFSLGILVAAGIIFFVRKNKPKTDRKTMYVMSWFFIPFVVMFILSYKIPMFLDRYLIYITPAYYILLAVSVAYIFKNKIVYTVFAILLTVSFMASVSLNPSKRRMVKETVEYIKTKKNSGTLVLVCPRDFIPSFAYYFNRNSFQSIQQDEEYGRLERLLEAENVYFVDHLNMDVLSKNQHLKDIIYLDAGADFAIADNHVKTDLENKFHRTEEKQFFEIFTVYSYARN